MRIENETIYLCDNGQAYCGEHLGYHARMTGRDISGQLISEVTPENLAVACIRRVGCERAGCSREVGAR